MPSLKDTTRIRTLLLGWYRKTARDFPWRVANVDPYIVFVSEIMLQQTQAARVAELLPPFLERFPDFSALAQASNASVITAWRGLGYNNRAIRLRDAARNVVEQHQGTLPRDEELLRTLPGIGPYASAAISTFAFNTYTVVIDVNIRRVYSRLHSKQPDTSAILSDREIKAIGETLIPKRNAAEWHHAVMDLGATICKARSTACGSCPLNKVCPSQGLTAVADAPSPLTRKQQREPMFRGEPRRLWRGRIVQALREHQHFRTPALVDLVFGPVTPEERQSIEDMMSALQRDGIITLNSRNIRLTD